jgi:hypothetical protein
VSRARLLAYAPRQLWDFTVERGLPIVALGVFVGGQLMIAMNGRGPVTNDAAALDLLIGVFRVIGLPFALIATAGVISNDRKQGFYRFLFAKPVSPVLYYLQAFLVNGIGLIASVAVLILMFEILVHPVNPFPLLKEMAVLYLALAGIVFFVSACFRADWIVVGAAWGASGIIANAWADGSVWQWLISLAVLPARQYGIVASALARQIPVPMFELLWLLGYSALFLLIGIFVVSRRNFAR